MNNIYAATEERAVIGLDVDARATFIARTYVHLFGAILAFTGLEFWLYSTGAMESLAVSLSGNWMLVLGAFMIVGWLATSAAQRARTLPVQYLALAGFVAAEAVIFAPLLYYAATQAPGVIQSAALVTLVGFAGLTMIAFWTRKDFSFLGALLRWVGVSALILIFASLIFGFHMGTWFSVAMVVFAGGAILFDTSNVLQRYPEDRYVAASLSLFSSVALLFWYVLRIFLASRD